MASSQVGSFLARASSLAATAPHVRGAEKKALAREIPQATHAKQSQTYNNYWLFFDSKHQRKCPAGLPQIVCQRGRKQMIGYISKTIVFHKECFSVPGCCSCSYWGEPLRDDMSWACESPLDLHTRLWTTSFNVTVRKQTCTVVKELWLGY